MLEFWAFVNRQLCNGKALAVLKVLQSKGSSPGRQGFQLAVTEDGDMHGSIGGGIMEHKLVELAKQRLQQRVEDVLFLEQIHRKETEGRQSGMICSGEQWVAMYQFYKADADWKALSKALLEQQKGLLRWSSQGLNFQTSGEQPQPFVLHYNDPTHWQLAERFPRTRLVHLIGGGHVGLALSRQLKWLGFSVILYDDRPALNTVDANHFADQICIDSYQNIGQRIGPDEHAYVVLMTFGYRSDKQVIRQLLGKKFKYLGMMGSAAKVAQLWNELRQEGFSGQQLSVVRAPIGLPIASKTPAEIAVSIAAELIKIKNEEG